MNGVGVLKAQMDVVHGMLARLIEGMRPDELTARPAPGLNLPGYTLWHMAATPDWVVHVVLRGIPEVRTQERWTQNPGINPPLPPFGCTSAQADGVAHAVTRDDLLAYARDVQTATHAWLVTLTDADLDRVPDLATNARRYPVERITPDYLAEIADQTAWNTARFLASPCIGHLRGHAGEIDVHLELLRAKSSG